MSTSQPEPTTNRRWWECAWRPSYFNAALALLVIPLLLLAAGSSVPTGPTPITLAWNYPTNELSTNLTFRLYHSTNITVPLTNWTVITNIAGTNTSVSLPVLPGAHFFALTASNFWGESDFSNVASTPPAPRSDVNLSISRGE